MQKNFAIAKNPKHILLIMMRYLGDVLLTTPLISSLHKAYPSAKIDVLVFDNTAAILEGNPDINKIITLSSKPKIINTLKSYIAIFQKYDLAVNTQTGDRPFIISLIAASKRIAAVPTKKQKGSWKRYFANGWAEFDNENTHTVLQHLKLASVLNIKPDYQITPPACQLAKDKVHLDNYAIIHPHPKWHYKRWPSDHWVQTCNYLHEKGLHVVLTGSRNSEELAYLKQIECSLKYKVLNLAGELSLTELTKIISQAKLFIGPDTGITHLAASTGISVIAIFGPTNPVKWAPWPYQYQNTKNPFKKIGNQKINNIFLLQGQGDCVPCHQEGCENHQLSFSKCLDNLKFSDLKHAINESLEN